MDKKEKHKVLVTVRAKLREKVPDFALKIQHIYQLLEWTWDKKGIPTVQEIRQSLYDKIDDLNSIPHSISSGGLCVWVQEDEAGMDFTVSEEIFDFEPTEEE